MLANQAAFLTMISHSEGTDRAVSAGVLVDPYRVCFGERHVIIDLSMHPAVSGEWIGSDGKIGEPLDFLGGDYIGQRSTAAGRYQIRKATFLELAAILHTTSFAPNVQDDMCILLVKRCGALALVNSGDVSDAIKLCNRTWASLPGSNAKQPQAELAALVHAYESAGGVLA